MKQLRPESITENNSPSLGLVNFSEFKENAAKDEIEILTELSLLDSFTLDEASKISSHHDLEQKIKSLLTRHHLALISTAPNRYQIKNLIKDGLRNLLSADEKYFRSIAFKSAEALKRNYPLKALEMYGLSGETEAATKHIIKNLHHFLLHSDLEILLKWAPFVAKALGGGLNREKLVKAYGLLASGKYESLKSTMREIESALGSDEISKSISEDLLPLRLYLDFSFGQFSKIFNANSKIVESVQDFSKLRNGTLLNRIFLVTYFYLQDHKSFTEYYSRIVQDIESEVPTIELVHMNSFKAMDSFLSGNYLEASEFALAACNLAEELEIEGAYFPFESAFILMDTQLEFGNEEKSQELVDEYLHRAIRTHQYPWIAAFYAKAALIKTQAGKVDLALSLIRKGRDVIDSPLFGSHVTFVIDGHELVIRLQIGDMECIKELLFKLASNGNHEGVNTFNYTMEIMRNPNLAEDIIELIANRTDQDKFRRELLLAVAYVNNSTKAISHIEKAVEIAIPNGYFRSFLFLPSNVKDLILQVAEKNPTNYLHNLARAIRNQTSLEALNIAAMDKPLTKQELVVLRRLDSGLPISQIAKALSISKNTIKTHLKSIYRKLSAESRHDAVSKAKELMLL